MAVSKLSTGQLVTGIPGPAKFEDPLTGNIISGTFTDASSISWKYWIFKSNSSIKCIEPGFADILVVGAGGTSAPFGYGGGGGAGGVLNLQDAFFNIGQHSVFIGEGAGPTNSSQACGPGTPSILGPYIAMGGGSSTGRYTSTSPSTYGGGSGAGGCASDGAVQAPTAGTTGQGNIGGIALAGQGGGGGGGAGAAGSAATTGTGGNGGIGIVSTIITTAIATSASVGQVVGASAVYFGGGGGGGSGTTQGTGGLGGGGNASATSSANATPFTGGGAGACGYSASFTIGAGQGSCGVVILRVRI